ncbi:MAG TPA: sugar phosphate nucleotidyltransferase [Verrucomicrobiae bacterium]|nr:sugar phosphate nucleotidyltransferase [Verrucomicrobiae bacterium]
MKKSTLLILAAGFGSRYGGLKQTDPVGPNGETIMDYSIHDAIQAGFDKLVFVIRRDIEKSFRTTIGAHYEKRIAVEYVFQELNHLPSGCSVPPNRKKPWGTGHAILMGAEVITSPFAVINADDFYGACSFNVLAEHLRAGTPDYAMVGFILNNTLSEFGSVARGICKVGAEGFLEGITEVTGIEKEGALAKYTDAAGLPHRLDGGEIVSMNMWGFTPTIFRHLQTGFTKFLKQHGLEEKSEFYIPSVVNSLIGTGQEKIKVLRSSDPWFGVTYREDRPRVVESIRRLIACGDYPEILWK